MEGTTLADALLDDLDDLSDVDDAELEEKAADEAKSSKTPEEEDETDAPVRYLSNPQLQSHMQTVRSVIGNASDTAGKSTSEQRENVIEIRNDEERYRLVTSSNQHLQKLHDEMVLAHGRLCMAYRPKFPELEELVPNPLQFVQTVRCIGNHPTADVATHSPALEAFLSANQIITITVSASTTNGRLLTESELEKVNELMSYMEAIRSHEQELAALVESQMTRICPNVCALIGPAVAARLLGLVGGLAELSKIPACNLQVLGQTRQTAASRAGASTAFSRPHEGMLTQCDLVQSVPNHLRKKALKTVAAKLALAVRCDAAYIGKQNSSGDNAAGKKFREEVANKIKLWEEPDKAQVLKALPKPDLTIKKRRGGKRMRRLKERYEETALMKQANTRAFSVKTGEYGDDAMGLTRGLLDTADIVSGSGGTIRRPTASTARRQVNTKASRKRDALLKAQASSSQRTSGLASSIVFTPVQGMELVDPEAQKKRVAAANAKWFQNDGFQSSVASKKKQKK